MRRHAGNRPHLQSGNCIDEDKKRSQPHSQLCYNQQLLYHRVKASHIDMQVIKTSKLPIQSGLPVFFQFKKLQYAPTRWAQLKYKGIPKSAKSMAQSDWSCQHCGVVHEITARRALSPQNVSYCHDQGGMGSGVDSR